MNATTKIRKKVYCAECGTLVLELVKGKIKPFKAICKKCDKPVNYDLPDSFKDIFGGFDK